MCKSDPAVFVWHNQSKVNWLLCLHVDDFLFREFFLSKVINPIGSEHCAAFKCLGQNISQSNKEIKIDQANYVKLVDYIAISKGRKR